MADENPERHGTSLLRSLILSWAPGVQRFAAVADRSRMEVLHLVDGRVVVVRLRELYLDDEQPCMLGYRRLLGVVRLAQVIEDQLGVSPEQAGWLAAAAVEGTAPRRSPPG